MLKFAVCFALLVSPLFLFADPKPLGIKLESQIWSDIKTGNWRMVEREIASDFQHVSGERVRSREQTINMLKNTDNSHYTLSNFKVTEGPHTLIVTYVMVLDPEGGHPSPPLPRLSVWRKSGDLWQWIAHTEP
jgi:hypothetical protein